MREFIVTHFQHFLCGLIFISGAGDIGSTFLLTPKLSLEANPVVRKLGWRFALLTILVCLIPYFSTAMGMMILVPSLLVSASNTAKIWFVRSYGETQYPELLYRLARTSKLSHALARVIVSAFFIALAGFVLLFLAPDPADDQGYWFALGILGYAFVIALYGSLYFKRLFKLAPQNDTPGNTQWLTEQQ